MDSLAEELRRIANEVALLEEPAPPEPPVEPPQATSDITRHRITWTFDKTYPNSLFANSDPWVVGPVKLVGVMPRSWSAARHMNGSMVNPSPITGTRHGFDSKLYGRYEDGQYQPGLNVALDVSPTNPLTLQAGSSLVSTISHPKAGNRPSIQGASILTVLDAPPAPGSFRPPYSGNDKTIRFNKNQLDYSLLKKLPRPANTPAMADVERYFERPWIDHIPGWLGRFSHPIDNMPDYGREMSTRVGVAALMLHLDFTDAEKEKLLISYVQLGIDLYGIAMDGGEDNWTPNGGHASARKWPILFAGMMLDDPSMKAIGSSRVLFGEDGQTFYETDGTPEWGIRHATIPSMDNPAWTADYRRCCTAKAWNGFVLAARIMGALGALTLWKHNALFDYMDRYIKEERERGEPDKVVSSSLFALKMWDTYRSQF